MNELVNQYLEAQNQLLRSTIVTDKNGKILDLSAGFERWSNLVTEMSEAKHKLIFIGNGGSAGIASHQAIDYSKAGGIRAINFSDPSLLTCLANDYGYEHIFEKAIELYADQGDLVVAISSSGQSPNILLGMRAAELKNCQTITFSGFRDNNPLRQIGNLNFYTPSDNYTLVENAHLILSHAFLACYLNPKLKLINQIKGIGFTGNKTKYFYEPAK